MDEFEEFRCRAYSAGRAPIGFNSGDSGIETFKARIADKRNKQNGSAGGMDKLTKGLDELSLKQSKPLALAYDTPAIADPEAAFKVLIGIAKYLVKAKKIVPLETVQQKIGCGDRPFKLALAALINCGFDYELIDDNLSIKTVKKQDQPEKIVRFQTAFLEEKFQQQYFCDVPLPVIQQALELAPADLS